MDNEKIRIHELAKQLNTNSKRICEKLKEINIIPKSHMSFLEGEELQAFYDHIGYNPEPAKQEAADEDASKALSSGAAPANEKKPAGTAGASRLSAGVVVRRVIYDSTQSGQSSAAAERTAAVPNQTGPTANRPPKKPRSNYAASSGLRAGYEVRSESYDELLREQEPESVPDTKTPSVRPAAAEGTFVGRVKRIVKPEPEETKEKPAPASPSAVNSHPGAEKEKKVSKPIVQDQPAEKLPVEAAKPSQVSSPDSVSAAAQESAADKDAAISSNAVSEPPSMSAQTPADPAAPQFVRPEGAAMTSREEAQRRAGARPVRFVPPVKPEAPARERTGTDRAAGQDRPRNYDRPRQGERPKNAGDRPRSGERPGPQSDRSRPNDRPRTGERSGGRPFPAIPAVDPAVAVPQESRREPAANKNFDRSAKKDTKKETPRPVVPPAKDKYKAARQLVGMKKGVSEVLSDDFSYSNSYDVEHGPQKRKPRKDKRDSRFNMREIAHNTPTIAVLTNVKLPAAMTVKELAESLKKTSADVIKKLMLMGIMANQNQEVDFETAAIIASEYGIKAEKEVVVTDEELLFEDPDDTEDDGGAVSRPPVVVVMGHVDHGKTSLLDAIRSTSVTTGEAGGITQHIGAYMVKLKGRTITFLDTPGHEAFTAMRARGAQVTDVAILVVAADDGVMPQTIEAINHAKAANVSIVVAVNKIDKPGANVDRVKQELAEQGVVAEEWGGDVPFIPVSAKKKENIELLLETVLLSADILELKANPEKQAKGTVIEAKLDKNRGPVATLLVQRGTLRPGDSIVSGTTFGHIRTMTDDRGQMMKKAGPSTPVEITGLTEVPEAGEVFYVVKDEKLAKHLIETRRNEYREKTLRSSTKVSLDDLFTQIQAGKVKELNLIVKADVQGSVEAVKQSLEKLSNEEVRIRIIHGGVGAINESDITLASVSNAIIIGFNVRPGGNIAGSAEAAGVDMRLYRVIYDAIEDIQAAMTGMLEPEYKEAITGHVEIRQIFKVSGVGTIAGGYVTDGKILRNSEVRIVRNGIVVYEGKLASLKRFKDDVKEVAQGFECGLSFERFHDIKEADVVECFCMEEIKR